IIVSSFVSNFWYLILSLPVVIYFAVKYMAKLSSGVRYQLDRAKLNVWLIGPILRKIMLSRFANYFALLYASGVTVLQSLEICEDLVGNRVISSALSKVRQEIEEGSNMSESFAAVGLFPPLVLRMIRIGESTGGLDTSLQNISYFYNRDVKDSIEKLQTLLEPVITVVLGLILGWVMLSVLGPIYDIVSKVKM
ncbi:type II secretion system F family protein, partial [Pseudomonadota bacterium]